MTIATVPSKTATPYIVGMRDRFFNRLYEYFKRDKRCVMLVADNGAPSLDQFGDNLPGQFYQCGIAEQQMIGMAAGMASEGRRVWCYAIAPFVTTRVHEFLKLDVAGMNLPIATLGIGEGLSYANMSITHSTTEDVSIIRVLPNMSIFSPADGVTAEALADISYNLNGPHYIRFGRDGVPDLYNNYSIEDFDGGMEDIWNGRQEGPVLVSTAMMTHTARKIASKIANATNCKVLPRVIDVWQIKPFNVEKFLRLIDGAKSVVSLEEHQLAGGLGSLIAETFADNGVTIPLLRIGMNQYNFELGGREHIQRLLGLDVDSIVKRYLDWCSRKEM